MKRHLRKKEGQGKQEEVLYCISKTTSALSIAVSILCLVAIAYIAARPSAADARDIYWLLCLSLFALILAVVGRVVFVCLLD